MKFPTQSSGDNFINHDIRIPGTLTNPYFMERHGSRLCLNVGVSKQLFNHGDMDRGSRAPMDVPGPRSVIGSMLNGSMGYDSPILINGVYWDYNPLILTFY